jgi:DUF4097 and DUF4098 domain-containing protein YvlB
MSNNGVGLGGFLLGLGVGWYLFRYIGFSLDIFAYILILLGVGIIINTLLGRGRRRSPLQGLFGGIIGGLLLSLFLTQGFGIIGEVFSEFGRFDVSDYSATGTELLSGDIELGKVYLEVDDKNGAISVETWEKGEYRIDLTLRAKGATNSQAEQRLKDIEVLFSDLVVGETQELELNFRVPNNQWSNYAVTVDVKLPTNVELELDLGTSNGEISLENILADSIFLDTANGDLTLNEVYADTLLGSISNGNIRGKVEGNNVKLSTSNGIIDIAIPSSTSGSYDLSSTNGSIDLGLSSSDNIGYNLDLTTSIGSIDVNLGNLGYSRNESRRKVAETEDFDFKGIQLTIIAETTIGSININ